MKEYRDLGIFQFDGPEEGIAIRFMWACLCDLSWRGKIEVIYRILVGRKPKWINNI